LTFLISLPAKGTLKKNVRPYKFGPGTVNRIDDYRRQGEEVTFDGFDIRKDFGPDPVTLYIFTAAGESYGIKAEDVEFPN